MINGLRLWSGLGTAQARELRDELRQYRESMGLAAYELAGRLGWSASKMSRIESGMTGITEVDVVRYAVHCGVDAANIDALLHLYREPGTPGYWMSQRLSTLALHETKAEFSSSYDPLVIPGLLQTEEYATELIGSEDLNTEPHRIPSRRSHGAAVRADQPRV